MNNGVNCTCILHVIITGEEKAGRMRTMNMKGSTNDNLNYMNDTLRTIWWILMGVYDSVLCLFALQIHDWVITNKY